MNKWKVEAEWSTVRRAVLWWEAYDSEFKDYKTFPTHAEAIAYADKRARTREVVLPRDTARPSKHLKIDSWITGATAITTVDDGASLLLNLKEIRPLALALLAHAERMEE